MEDQIDMLRTRVANLENMLADLVDEVEQGSHIDFSQRLQDLIADAKCVLEGEVEE